MKKLILKKKKKSKAPKIQEPEIDDLFGDLDDDDDLFSELETGTEITVKLEYDKAALPNRSMLLMESLLGMQFIINDYGIDHAINTYQAHSRTSAGILGGDRDRFFQFIFAAEFLREYGTKEDWDKATIHGRPVNPAWDSSGFDEKQDGKIIGGVDDYKEDAVPVREQVKKAESDNIEKHRPNMTPAVAGSMERMSNLPKLGDYKRDPQANDRIWEMAVEKAKLPCEEWEGKVDPMLETKIKYCHSWMESVGSLTVPYPADRLSIFWPKPIPEVANQANILRRNEVVTKVINFWRSAVEKNKQQGTQFDIRSKSYRVTLAAMALAKAIDEYVSAGSRQVFDKDDKGNDIIVPDDTKELQAVQLAARNYFTAHVPASLLGGKPGPMTTLDPEYPEYVTLCRTYNIQVGTLLHEVTL